MSASFINLTKTMHTFIHLAAGVDSRDNRDKNKVRVMRCVLDKYTDSLEHPHSLSSSFRCSLFYSFHFYRCYYMCNWVCQFVCWNYHRRNGYINTFFGLWRELWPWFVFTASYRLGLEYILNNLYQLPWKCAVLECWHGSVWCTRKFWWRRN